MDAAAYLLRLRQRAKPVLLTDPLRAAQSYIDKYGNTGEGNALLSVVRALWKGEGEFSESDIYSLSTNAVDLAGALIHAREEGVYPEWRWHRAASYPAWRFLLDLHKNLRD